jgi:hypothetical protein
MVHLGRGDYGNHLNVYDWSTRQLVQRLDLGSEGNMAFEIRCQSGNM